MGLRMVDKMADAINMHLSFTREVQSLEQDGYYVLFDSQTLTGRVVKMKHLSNGRTLTLILTRRYWQIREQKNVLKTVEIPIRRN